MSSLELAFARSMLPPAPSELFPMPQMYALRRVSSMPPPDPRMFILMAGGLLLFFVTCVFAVVLH